MTTDIEPQQVGERLKEALLELRALVAGGAAAVPAPVAFAVGDALEAVELALGSAGHVGLLAPQPTQPPASREDACRRLAAVRNGLLEVAGSAPAAARTEIAVAASMLWPWTSPAQVDLAERTWSGQGVRLGADRDG
ncbi:hypothetical protein GCM10027446_01380 [Angustibacter peucedani]